MKGPSLGVTISAVAHCLPDNEVSNQAIIDLNNLRLKDSWIRNHIGIETRRWCRNGESASDLGAQTLTQLVEKSGTIPDALIVSTVSPDLMTPSTAAIIQSLATPGATYPAFDITAACSGFLYALDTGRRLVQSGMNHVACVATEIRSYYLNKKDRRTAMLFGDGSGGVMLSRMEPHAERGLIHTQTACDGRYWETILVVGSGSRRAKGVGDHSATIDMRDAVLISESAARQMVSLVVEGTRQVGLTPEAIDFFVFHQANGKILGEIAQALGLAPNRFIANFRTRGNMTSASVAVALSEAVAAKQIKKGDLVMMVAVGGGYTSGVSIFRWELDEP